MTSDRRAALIVAALLFGSGFSALVYQILWLRVLGLVFGVTVHAASTVLASFMAGLALGSLLAGRLSDRVRVPLRWFGAAEILIGTTALLTPVALTALDAVYRSVYTGVTDDFRLLTVVRFACSFAVLLIPTTLMGATVPLAMRSVIQGREHLGTRAAAVYAANTAGALLGAVTTGFYLISTAGISASFRIAAIVNVLVGAAALLRTGVLHRRVATASPLPRAAVDNGDHPAGSLPALDPAGAPALPGSYPAIPESPPRERAMVVTVFGISGFVALALEIIWFRALVLYLPATTYVFTIILAVVLGGIAAGSAVATRALRRNADWISRLAVLQIGVALAATVSMVAQGWTYAAGWRTSAALQGAALSVLPATLLMGAAFPIGLACWTAHDGRRGRSPGDRIGRFYLVNLSGAIVGAVAAGFLLVPWLGTRRSIVAVASLALLSGLLLLATRTRSRPRFVWTTGIGGLAAFLTAATLVPDPLQAVLARRYTGERVLWREEGAQSTVSVHQGAQRIMYLDGLHQANDSPPMVALHRQIGALAMALHPQPRDALVIGLGGGATAGAAADFSQASVDIVELSPSVIRAADWFRHTHGDVTRRANVRIRVDDGRNYLLLTPKRYDVITADIIQPIHAGAGSLYSLEYFRLAARTLRQDGVMLQWIGNRPETHYKLIARTFLEAFPHTTVWANGTLLVGTQRPLRLSRSAYARRLVDPTFSAAVRTIGIEEVDDLLRLYTAGPEELRAFVGSGPVLTDDRPLVEFFRSLPRDEPEIQLGELRGDVARHVGD
jgi:spermidine synthase